MAMHDLVIRGATVVDGLGHDPIRTDLAVRDGRISRLYRGRRRPTHRRGSPPS
jgi:N-acyl-D-aspartate/D-glutamate deacylase